MSFSRTDRSTRLARMIEVSQNLSANLELEALLKSIIELTSELTFSQSTTILIGEENADHLNYISAPWFELDKLKPLNVPVDHSVAGWVYKHCQPLVIQDAAADQRLYREVDRVRGYGTASLISIPLTIKSQTIGVIQSVNKMDKTNYTEEDVTTLEYLGSQAAVAIYNDRLIEKSQQAYRQLLELDRMKTDFIAISSHELRTPLGLILGHATFMEESAQGDEKEQLNTIIKNAMHLKDIIDDLEDVDDFQKGMTKVRRRQFAMDRLISDVVGSYHEMAHTKKVSLKTEISKANLTVDGDAHKIRIVLSNLIKNAITFTDEGDHVMVTADQLPGYIKVSVIDDGIGIPAKDLKRIFERFYQVESHLTRRHGGMGLGLPIAKGFVEMHGGRIWVESIEGKGSNFTFLLPLNVNQASAAQRVFLE
jgi:signal transduction histidine kinase